MTQPSEVFGLSTKLVFAFRVDTNQELKYSFLSGTLQGKYKPVALERNVFEKLQNMSNIWTFLHLRSFIFPKKGRN